jgi:hypothetical protein
MYSPIPEQTRIVTYHKIRILKIKNYRLKEVAVLSRWARGFRSRVEVIAGNPVAPQGVTAEYLHDLVSSLRGDNEKY